MIPPKLTRAMRAKSSPLVLRIFPGTARHILIAPFLLLTSDSPTPRLPVAPTQFHRRWEALADASTDAIPLPAVAILHVRLDSGSGSIRHSRPLFLRQLPWPRGTSSPPAYCGISPQ